MADYLPLGDTFGYHAGYPANSSQQNAALGASQPGAGQAGLGMLPGSVPGQQSYHPALQTPRPGYPQTDPLMSHKMHPGYPGYPGAIPPGSASALRPQYSQGYMPHASMDSYASLSMGQAAHLSAAAAASGQSLGSPYGSHQNLMGQYAGQRMHTPTPLHAGPPRHPSMPSQYASSPYGSSAQSVAPSYHTGSTSDLWSSGQNLSSLQQSPFGSFQSSPAGAVSASSAAAAAAAAAAASAATGGSSSSSLHSSRPSSQFGPSSSDYGPGAANPYASFASHLSAPDSSYPPGYPSVSSSQSQSTTSRSSSSSSRSHQASQQQQQQQQQAQQQYSSQLGPYSSSLPTPQATPQSAANSVSASSAARFSHYSSYPGGMPSFDPSAQARLSPYPTPTPSSGSNTPNSPQYRTTSGYPQSGSSNASSLPVLSPRRPTATPPAGSPMPPTSHTPGPPSVGSNSTQGSTQGSAFSIATPNSGGHHLSNSSSSGAPSSLQQLEQMVMPHLGGSDSSSNSSSSRAATSKANSSSANASSTFFPSANSAANSSPISPQAQAQSKLFNPHFAASSPSTHSSPQYPYHGYSQGPPPTDSWQNTHLPLKPSAMIAPPPGLHVGAPSHLSSAPTNASSKSSHSSSGDGSSLHQPYSYGSSSKSSSDQHSSAFSASTGASHSSPSSHNLPPSQGGYNNLSSSGLASYETLSSAKQSSSHKNDTQSLGDLSSLSGPQSQSGGMSSLNSNSYHSMMQQSPYSTQSLSGYGSASRFDHPMANQYGGMSSGELGNSSYDPHDSSMMNYDPYSIANIDMAPPHQSMSEYREAQANMQQQSGADFSDPYAANFDDFETTTGKRKGKGRPKKEPAPKKERKPRAPRAPSTRGRGRGRGKNAVAERVPLPGMMSDFGDPSGGVPPYGVGPPSLGPPGSDPSSLDMYGNAVDLYPGGPMAPGKMVGLGQMPVEPPPGMMTGSVPSSLSASVLSQPPVPSDCLSPYGPPPPSSQQASPQHQQQQQQASSQMSQQQLPQPQTSQQQLMSNSLSQQQQQQSLMAPMAPIGGSPFEQMTTSMGESPYPSYVSESLSNEGQQPLVPSLAPPSSLPPSVSSGGPLCDTKELPQESKSNTVAPPPPQPPMTQPSSAVSYDDRYMSEVSVNNSNNDPSLSNSNSNGKHIDANLVPAMTPSGGQSTISNDDVEMNDGDKSAAAAATMSFNSSSMDSNSCPQTMLPQPPMSQQQQQQQSLIMPPMNPMNPSMELTPYSSLASTVDKVGYETQGVPPQLKGELPNDHLDSSKVMLNNYDMSGHPMLLMQPQSSFGVAGQPPISMPGMLGGPPPPPEYVNSYYGSAEDANISDAVMHGGGFVASTPIVEKKAKKPKKRKSKKTDDTTIIEEEMVIKEEDLAPVVEKTPKKKKRASKKAKASLSEDALAMDSESLFMSELDDKTQMSLNLDSTISSETETPKPKRSKKKAAPKKPKVAPVVDSTLESDFNATEGELNSIDLNGDTSLEAAPVEPVEEKPKKPKVKSKSPKKKMPRLALKLKANKKRRRGFGSPDNSDIERTPPPSPTPEDDANKRRSSRNTKRQRYNDDLDLDLSDDDFPAKKGGSSEDSNNVASVQLAEDTMVVEKFLASRMGKRELEFDPPEPAEAKVQENGEAAPSVPSEPAPEPEPVFIDVEEFYVKYKNLSYLHCDWKTEEELEKGDRRISQKLKRYRQKKDINVFDFLDEEPFNPDYIEVDRVLDVNEIEEWIDDEEEEAKPALVPEPKLEVKSDEKVSEEKTEEKPEEEKAEKSSTDDEIKSEEKIPDEMEVEPTIEEKTEGTSEEIKPEVAEDEETKAKESIADDDDNKTDPGDIPPTTAADSVAVETEEPTPAPAPKEKKKKKRISRHFLVKWRGLSYEESTWELEEDVDPLKIEQFYKFRQPPPRSEWKIKKRPKAHEWKKRSESHIYKNGNYLREYQLEGVNWLTFCWHNGQNCILADEMGLGKTIQSITFVAEMVNYGIPYPYLIIVPLSTIGNWQREFETWTDLNVVTYHGSTPSRQMLQEYEMYYKNEKNERIPNVYKFQVMITTFEVILSDCLELSQIKWVACIIDEAHRLKNRNCKLLEGLRMLPIDHRVLLSGTPLQNNVEELYSLLHFLEPAQFASNENFLSEFGDLKTEAQVDKLKAILKPMMLRRLKEDVEKSLAPKEETIIEVELTNVQKKYYRAILERNFAFLSKGGTSANIPNLMNTVMELRKCCIHPFLINGAEEQIISEYRQQHHQDETLGAIVQASGKLVLIDKLLPRLKENGHRVLIFSQMVRCLDILEDYLCQKRYPFERIDGRVRGNLRQAAIDRFSKPDSDRFVFLLCTRAGGLGINLTAADTVIIFDSDWNPQNDLQAQARCHRIGQKKLVKVYRLICRNTYEREMFDRASLKLGLDKAVLQSINSKNSNLPDNQLSKSEIEDLLRKGAYGALMDDDNAGDKFCEEDIDIILQRRTTKVIIESEGKGGSFSKASFATSDNRTDIEIDDPNFWEKWAKKANFDLDELKNRNDLVLQEPRKRTQTKRFGADDAMLDITDLETSTDDEEAISMRTRGSRNRPLNGKSGGKRRKGRGNYDPEHDEDYAQEVGFGWSRYEYFRVEKALLTYGWGRWDECVKMANFKRDLTDQDVEDISRIVLLFSLQNYKGDEKVKSYVLELITPPSEKGANESSNGDSNGDGMLPTIVELDVNKSLEQCLFSDSPGNSGCRRARKKLPIKSVGEELETLDWAKNDKYNPEIHLPEEYRKHLLRHANKLLLRVRLLTYIKNDIIGDLHEKVVVSHVRDIPIPYCQPDTDPPTLWWDEDADKSLLIGVYKHGYDRFALMRTDGALCFLSRCGPPDGAQLLAELSTEFDEGKTMEEDEPDTPATPATPQIEGKEINNKEESKEKAASLAMGSGDEEGGKEKEAKESTDETAAKQASPETSSASSSIFLPFPNGPELNNRLRRLVTSYQRHFKKEETRIAQKARHQQRIERIEKFEAVMRAKEAKKREQAQNKWSRREEADFYRTVSTLGVTYNRKTEMYDWGRFRTYAKLERKLDETLTEYFKAFCAMCKKVVGRTLTEDEENLPISVDPITEEKANRCLGRIDLLCKVREEIIFHPELDERLKLAQNQLDLPDWWICGKHDKDLLLGIAKYGFYRLDFNLMNDPELCFIDVVRSYDNPTSLEALTANANMIAMTLLEKKPTIEDVDGEVRALVASLLDKVDSEWQSMILTGEEAEKPEASKEIESEEAKNEEKSAAQKEEKMDIDETTDEKVETEVKMETSTEVATKEKPSKVEDSETDEKNVRVKAEESESETTLECKAPVLPPSLTNGDTSSHLLLGETKENSLKPLESLVASTLEPTTMVHTCGLPSMIVQPRASFKWPRDRVLQLRLENIVTAVEKNEWPTFRGLSSMCSLHSTTPSIATADSSPRPSTPCSLSSASQEHTPHPTPEHTPRRESQSPFTGEYTFYSQAANSAAVGSAGSLSGNLLNSFELPVDTGRTKQRRRRRRRYEIENDRNNKLHSLLNQFEQPNQAGGSSQQTSSSGKHQTNAQVAAAAAAAASAASSKHHSPISSATNSALSSLASQLFAKNPKNQSASSQAAAVNSLLGSMANSQFLTPLLNQLPFSQLRNAFRDHGDLFGDEKASLLLSNSLAAVAAASGKASGGKSAQDGSSGSKGNHHSSSSGPPPAHQSSSSRNSHPLGTLDLTAKFKNASSAALEKASHSSGSSSRSNHPYPAHKAMKQSGQLSEKADVLDLSSMGTSSKHDPKSAMSMLSASLQKSMDASFKNSAFLAAHQAQQAQQQAQERQQQQQASLAASAGKKKGRIGSRIDALALNLQAKKMMQQVEEVKQVDNATTLLNKSQQAQAQAQAAAAAAAARMTKGFTDKELLAALSGLGGPDKRSSIFLDEISKQTAALQNSVGKGKNSQMNSSAAAMNAAAASAFASMMQQSASQTKKAMASNDPNKATMNLLESLKLFSGAGATSSGGGGKNAKSLDAGSFMSKNFKSLLEEHPEFMSSGPSSSASLSALLNSPLSGMSGLSSASSANLDDKKPPGRSSKRSRNQFESPNAPSSLDEPSSKRAMLSSAKSAPFLDPKNPSFNKYFSTLLDGKNEGIEAKIKNLINDKSSNFKDFKTPTSMSSNSSGSIRTRTSDKRSSGAASSSASSLPNLNAASHLLNSLSSMAAASGGGSSSAASKAQQQQQQSAAAALLANWPSAAFGGAGSGGSSNSKSAAAASAAASAAAASAFSNSQFSSLLQSGLGNSMFSTGLSGFPSMKMFLDAAAAAAQTGKSSAGSTSGTSTTTSSSQAISSASSSATNPSMSSFASLLSGMGMNNPLLNSFNLANLSALTGQSPASKKEGGSSSGGGGGATSANSGMDFASLMNNFASANLANDDKSKGGKGGGSMSSAASAAANAAAKNKANANSAAALAASMLGGSGLGSSGLPFGLYGNPGNFNPLSMYGPLGLSNFAALGASPFLNNPNLMNGLANFSNVFTSTTPTMSSGQAKGKTSSPSSSRSSASTRATPSRTSTMSSSAAAAAAAAAAAVAASATSAAASSNASGLSLASGLLSGGGSRGGTAAGTRRSGGGGGGGGGAAAGASSAATGALDSDDESLKSLMGNDDEDDLNGDFDPEHTDDRQPKAAKRSRPSTGSRSSSGKSRRSNNSK